MRLAVLEAEGEIEAERARQDAEHGWYQLGFLEGLRARKAAVHAEIASIKVEEAGARDALTEAFEALKKYENVVETARVVARKEEDRRETAMLDELGLRKRA